MPPKTNKYLFIHLFWNESEFKVIRTPTLMCTFTVVHDFGNQECVVIGQTGKMDTGKEGFRFIVLELNNSFQQEGGIPLHST